VIEELTVVMVEGQEEQAKKGRGRRCGEAIGDGICFLFLLF
jgi:hypothetical protein